MRKAPIVLLLLFVWDVSFAQQKAKQARTAGAANIYSAIDSKMSAIPEAQTSTTADVAKYINANFTTEKDKARAIYAFTTSAFEYDYDNMFAINFYDKNENKADKIMKSRKGICENFSAVFNDLCFKCRIKSFVIAGYTRQHDYSFYLPHAWCGAIIDNEYYLFDPTWGSGYVDNKKFIKKRNNEYFMQRPGDLIRTHMPFDPMWQLLHYPITTKEFEDGKTTGHKSNYFSFPDSIAAYEKMAQLERYESEARRIEGNGVKTALTYYLLANVRQNIDVEKQNSLINSYNSAFIDYNVSINDLNDFVNYKNKRFTPVKPDREIQGMIDNVHNSLNRAAGKLAVLKGKDTQVDAMIAPLEKQMADMSQKTNEQREFLKKYFKKNKVGRKTMIYTYAIIGPRKG